MKFAVRSKPATALPGVVGPARILRRSVPTSGSLHTGEVVVVEQLDMDRATAQRLVDAGVAGVVNTLPMVSGRFPNQGPAVLLDAGIEIVEAVGTDAVSRLRDGTDLRLHDGDVWAGDDVVASGRRVDHDSLSESLGAARQGMTSQLETFIHNGAEFVRREQDLLLHDIGVPTLTVPLAGRPVVLAAPARDLTQQMKALRPFIREQDPVVVAVGAAADILASAGFKARVVVVGGIDDELPRAKVLKKAREVVAVVDRGAPQVSTERLERLGLRPHRFETGASLEDAALILVDHGQPSLIVGAGTGATLPDFLDRARPGVASAFVTRLRVGSRLIDAAAVPQLYDGAVRPRHLAGVLLAGIVALGAAVSVTPVGQEWFDALMPALQSVPDHVRGLIP